MKWGSLASQCTDDETEEPRGQEFYLSHITNKRQNWDSNSYLSNSRH